MFQQQENTILPHRLTHRLTDTLVNRYSTLLRRNTRITLRPALHGGATIYLCTTRSGVITADIATATMSVRTIAFHIY